MSLYIHGRPGDNYTVIPNWIIHDPQISWKTKGLLSYLLSKPDGWEFSGHRIAQNGKGGKDQIFSSLREMESLGILLRKKKPDGKSDYHLYLKRPNRENPDQGVAKSGKSLIGKIPTISKTEDNSKTEENIITKNSNNLMIPFFRIWQIYPKKVRRHRAEAQWELLSRKEKKEAIENLPKWAKQFKQREHKFIPHLSTYLRERLWEDEIEERKSIYRI